MPCSPLGPCSPAPKAEQPQSRIARPPGWSRFITGALRAKPRQWATSFPKGQGAWDLGAPTPGSSADKAGDPVDAEERLSLGDVPSRLTQKPGAGDGQLPWPTCRLSCPAAGWPEGTLPGLQAVLGLGTSLEPAGGKGNCSS